MNIETSKMIREEFDKFSCRKRVTVSIDDENNINISMYVGMFVDGNLVLDLSKYTANNNEDEINKLLDGIISMLTKIRDTELKVSIYEE